VIDYQYFYSRFSFGFRNDKQDDNKHLGDPQQLSECLRNL